MFRVEILINMLFNIAICTAPQVITNSSNIEYHVKIRKIDEQNFKNNTNGVFVYSEDKQQKKYFEIEFKFLKKNDENTKTEVVIENAVFEIKKVGDNILPLSFFSVDKNKELTYVKDINPSFLNNNKLKVKHGIICNTYLEKNKIGLFNTTETVVDSDSTICDRFFMFEAVNPEDVEIKDNVEFSIPIDKFIANKRLEIFEKKNEIENQIVDSEVLSEERSPYQQTNDFEEEPVEIVIEEHESEKEMSDENMTENNESKTKKQAECKDDAKNKTKTKTEKMFVESNDSLKLVTKIIYGVIVPLICVCILICVFVVLKRRKTSTKKSHYTTVSSEFKYYQV